MEMRNKLFFANAEVSISSRSAMTLLSERGWTTVLLVTFSIRLDTNKVWHHWQRVQCALEGKFFLLTKALVVTSQSFREAIGGQFHAIFCIRGS